MLWELIGQRRAAVADRWRERILAGYPDQTGRFLEREPDRFANPVGHTLRETTAATVAALAERRAPEELGALLDSLVHIRAVQELCPSRALAFVLELKAALREVLADSLDPVGSRAELDEAEAWVDRLLLVAFDLHAACREQVFSIRVNEIRNRSMKVMERLNEWRERRQGASVTPDSGDGR
jgi:hypothetical protein